MHTVTFSHGFVLFHNPKGVPIYFQTIENDAKTLSCAHSVILQYMSSSKLPTSHTVTYISVKKIDNYKKLGQSINHCLNESSMVLMTMPTIICICRLNDEKR